MSGRQVNRDFCRPTGRPTSSPLLFSTCRDSDGRHWAAWQATEGSREVIRVLCPEVCSGSEAICEPGLHFEPTLVAAPAGGLWCIWSHRIEGQWRLVVRRRDKQWRRSVLVPTDEEFVFHVVGAGDAAGHLWLAYAAWNNGQFPQIVLRCFNGTTWSPPLKFADLPAPQVRPSLAAGPDGHVWLAFCAYRDSVFDVVTAELLPGRPAAPTVTMVPADERSSWSLFPSICLDATGTAWLAWVVSTDVEREGVVGRRHNLDCARWDGSVWTPPPGADDFTVTHLDWGMLPVQTYYGYNGLRRRPQLARDAHGMWLFWERHRDEQPVPENVANGQFCAKYHDGNGWSSGYLVQDGHSCFTVDSADPQPDDTLVFAAKTAPTDAPLDIAFLRRSRSELQPLLEYPKRLWAGWQQVQLPGQITGEQPPHAITCRGETFHLVWGDLHCHSYYSPDAEGEPIELLLYARDRGGLDFAAIMDNDYYPDIVISHSTLDYLYAVAQALSSEEFMAFWGYEYTYHQADEGQFPMNHRALVYYDRDQPLARRCHRDGRTAEAFVATMKDSATLWHAHHEEWQLFGEAQEENVEVCAGWFDYMQVSDVVQRHLRQGYRFGLTGASDNHRLVPGMGGAVTGLYVRDRSRQGIVEALQQRRCFATTGCRLLVDFRVNDHLMGSELESTALPRLSLLVQSRSEIATAVILRDEQIIATLQPGTAYLEWHYTDQEVPPGLHFYRAQVQLVGEIKTFPHNIASAAGPRAYSSPIWVKVLDTVGP